MRTILTHLKKKNEALTLREEKKITFWKLKMEVNDEKMETATMEMEMKRKVQQLKQLKKRDEETETLELRDEDVTVKRRRRYSYLKRE